MSGSIRPVLLLAAVLSLAGGCSFLEPRADPTRYYVLTPVVDSSERVQAVDVRLSLGPVDLPTYLDRPEIVSRPAPHRLDVRQNERWAEPLPSAFTRVLRQNLAALLGPDAIVDFPSTAAARGLREYVLDVDVLRFEESGRGRAELSARWTLKDARARSVVVAHESTVGRPVTSSDGAAAAAALSECVGDLSRDVARALAEQPR